MSRLMGTDHGGHWLRPATETKASYGSVRYPVELTVTYEPSYLARLLRTARETLKLSRQALADEIG